MILLLPGVLQWYNFNFFSIEKNFLKNISNDLCVYVRLIAIELKQLFDLFENEWMRNFFKIKTHIKEFCTTHIRNDLLELVVKVLAC